MDSWLKCWRDGFAPQLSDESLEALLRALIKDDPTLIQGANTFPTPMQCTLEWPVEGACAIGYCGWKEGLATVGEVNEFFARLCFDADTRLGELGGCRWFLNFWDDTPREELHRLMIPEIRHELGRREQERALVLIAE